MHSEPLMDIAHLGHLELLTPKPEESRRFFIDIMGMTESGAKGDSVYLRGWDDYERYCLKLTASKTISPRTAGSAIAAGDCRTLGRWLSRPRILPTAALSVASPPTVIW